MMNEYRLDREHAWPRVSLGQFTTWTPFTTWTLFTSSLSQENYVPLLGAFQTSLYLWYPPWYPLTTLNNANVHTILAPHVMIK